MCRLEKEGKIKEFWSKLIVTTLISAINAFLSTITLYYAVIGTGGAISFEKLLRIGIVSWFLAGYAAWSSAWSMAWSSAVTMAWCLTVAGAWQAAGAWSAVAVVGVGVGAWSVVGVAALAGYAAVIVTAEELLESLGKWKATMILFATGLAGLGVGLLVKVLFVR
ncbi:MAG: hypothetical protein WCQ26_11230 [Pseudanabaena sp. ELA748]